MPGPGGRAIGGRGGATGCFWTGPLGGRAMDCVELSDAGAFSGFWQTGQSNSHPSNSSSISRFCEQCGQSNFIGFVVVAVYTRLCFHAWFPISRLGTHLFLATLLPRSISVNRETEFRILLRSQSGDWERGGEGRISPLRLINPEFPKARSPGEDG